MKRANTFCFLAACALSAAVFDPPVSSDTVALTDRQMVHESRHVVVAVVEGARARWNSQHTLIFTDYVLRIEDRLKGSAPARITLPVPGGTLDGETHTTSLDVQLVPGSRYLLFLGDLGQPTLEPITGAEKGIFREVAGPAGRSFTSPGTAAPPLSANGRPPEFGDFVAAVRDLVTRVAEHPEPGDRILKANGGARPPLPVKDYDPAAAPEKNGSLAVPASEPAETPPPPWTSRFETGDSAPQDGSSLRSIRDLYVYQYAPPALIAFDGLPKTSPYSPHDQYQMAYWNVYAKNLFRVRARTSSTWTFGNGVFDLAGFPGNRQMIRQFGSGWGATTLGITWTRIVDERIVEADIALNPAFSWTLDDRVSTRPDQPASFQHTLLHELGHAWGLQHPWETQNVWWDSVMNYAPQQYRLARLLTDDAIAARSAYPGLAVRDGALSAYSTQDALLSNHPTYVRIFPSRRVVRAGESFSVTNSIKVDNTGSVGLANPVIEVYLVPQRFSFSGSIFLKSIRYPTTINTSTATRFGINTLTVPRSARAGTYYLAFFLRDPADARQANNSAWSDYDVTVVVTR